MRPRIRTGTIPAALTTDALPRWQDDPDDNYQTRKRAHANWTAAFEQWRAERARWAIAHDWPGGDDTRLTEEASILIPDAPWNPDIDPV